MASSGVFDRLVDDLFACHSILEPLFETATTLDALEIQKAHVQTIWDSLQNMHQELIMDETVPSNEMVKHRERYFNLLPIYAQCVSKIAARQRALTPAFQPQHSSSPNPPPRTPEAPLAPSFHLPPIEIEHFSGDYSKWPSFRDLFTAIFKNNRRLADVEKLFHLRNKTRGEALEIVSEAPLTNDGFALAWAALVERFENKRLLVNNQLKTLMNLPSAQQESSGSLKLLQRTLNGCKTALSLLGVEVDSWDPLFVYLGTTKLSESSLSCWEESNSRKTQLPSWKEFDSFLSRRFLTLESIADQGSKKRVVGVPERTSSFPTPQRNTRMFATTTVANPRACQMCNLLTHSLRQCPKFGRKSTSEKRKLVRDWQLCFNCLAHSHFQKDCKSPFSCSRCRERHHTILHEESNNQRRQALPPPAINANPIALQTSNDTSENPSTLTSCLAIQAKGVLLGTAIISVHRDGVPYPVRALLDSGSEATFISERLQKLLKLPSRATSTTITGISQDISTHALRACDITISSQKSPSELYKTEALVLRTLVGRMPSQTFDARLFASQPDFQLADPKFFESDHIDVLLGGDLLPQLMLDGVKHNVFGSLLAQNTVFGWILSGPVPSPRTIKCNNASVETEMPLDALLKKFWELEDLPSPKLSTAEDAFVEDHFQKTVSRTSSGQYLVHLPFRPEFPELLKLGQSRCSAMAQFMSHERRLLRDPQLKGQYENVLREYLTLDHMVRIDHPTNPAYYLPHHAVFKPDSTTTKIRVVFNASNKTSNAMSLNDVLCPGPALQADLPGLISRWRIFRYVFNGDIEKMYRQILVTPDHQKFQRILMRDPTTSEIAHYQLKTVTFGVNCAPFLAIRTLHHLADVVRDSHPLASEILKEYMYVDDALGGAHDLSTAIQAKNELVEVLSSAKFPIRKWTSNSKEFLKDLPRDHLLREDFLDFADSSHAKTLGIYWNALTDSFHFKSVWDLEKVGHTKRQVLSQIAKLFDPIGWLAPYVILAKIIMQDIWLSQVGWDEQIPVNCQKRWDQFVTTYPKVQLIKIPRWLDYTPSCKVEYHGFCDASEKAYAAAIYLRVSDSDRVISHLITAKSRVAPVKTTSLPRLELCGAILLTELMESFTTQLPLKTITRHYWTDSTIVLSWLQKNPGHWTTFVANRIAKIQQLSTPEQWRHVRSENNPADLATRGLHPEELAQSKLWWQGPAWLTKIHSEWPQATIQMDGIPPETRQVKTLTTKVDPDELFLKFSSFTKTVRIFAYVYRFFRRCHPTTKMQPAPLSTTITQHEMSHATSQIVKAIQSKHFANEIRSLLSNEPVSKDSSLRALNPFICKDKFLRVSGRLVQCPAMSYDESHPIILPAQHHLTKSYLRFIHEVSMHGEVRLMMRLVRLKYWIPRVKTAVRQVIHQCKVCTIYRQSVQTQLMGALPPKRTIMARPFTNTGMDFAGPFDVRSSPHSKSCYKCYVCIFVCFSTKAIHLEVTTALSTQAFLAAFQRFVSRRGTPSNLYSDNGTTFVGADKALAKEFFHACRFGLPVPGVVQQPQWHFIPPSSPNMGGLWEAGVKSFKLHFKKVAGSFKYTYEEFTTLVYQVEACLNSRPLTALSENPEDLGCLTPGHFLTGGPLLAPAEDDVYEDTAKVINRWQRLKAIHHDFCRQWKDDYLSELHKRQKWQTVQPNLKVDDLVVVMEDNLFPHEWRLGRVAKCFPGKDDLLRVVEIRTQRGIIKRPTSKLIPLPLES